MKPGSDAADLRFRRHALLTDHHFRADLMIEAFAMNVVLFAAAVAGF